jgi:hypothetical protein
MKYYICVMKWLGFYVDSNSMQSNFRQAIIFVSRVGMQLGIRWVGSCVSVYLGS